jgi:hypothetical protein
MPLSPTVLRRPPRPAAPRCHGGVSSLLRVSASAARRSARAVGRWLQVPAPAAAGGEPQPGFITPLQPSAAVRAATGG